MADLKLVIDPVLPYDLDISAADLAIVTGDDAIVQHLTIRFQFFRGEWFLDERVGIPYFTDVLVKQPSLTDIRTLISRTITTTPGIDELLELSLGLDVVTRRLSIEFSARKDDGLILDFSQPFILPGGVNETPTEVQA